MGLVGRWNAAEALDALSDPMAQACGRTR
ncbi:protein of unknown function [Streptantibioticus cattleyicolor NRRL 8057 = DSM 46488]|nr:protein of unknown function [Streptantibioticus cattleyicolor NRRL 8057 = DSM 46488]